MPSGGKEQAPTTPTKPARRALHGGLCSGKALYELLQLHSSTRRPSCIESTKQAIEWMIPAGGC